MLWRGKKFHFRCYSLLQADMSTFIYQKAYILSAGLDYDINDEDSRKHISNLSVNKRIPGHPGQVPCDLLLEFPEVRRTILYYTVLLHF